MADVIRELLATEAAMAKLAGRGISTEEAEQVLRNAHVTVRNPRDEHGKRRLLVGPLGRRSGIDARCRSDDRADDLAAGDRVERHRG